MPFDVQYISMADFVAGQLEHLIDFDIIVVDLGTADKLGSNELHAVRSKFKHYPFIFISNHLNNDQMRHLVRLEGRDWLEHPITSKDLFESIKRVETDLSHEVNKNFVHAFISAGGGSGGTTVAISFAAFLKRPTRKNTSSSVSIFDLDFANAAVGSYLNIENSHNLENTLFSPERVDLEYLNVIKKQHHSGLDVLSFYSPRIPNTKQGAELVLRILDITAFQNNHTVLDMSSNNNIWNDKILSNVDTITVVTIPRVPLLRNAKRIVKNIQSSSEREIPITIVVNKVPKNIIGRTVKNKEIKEAFEAHEIYWLPSEIGILNQSLDQGELPITIDPSSGFCKELNKFSKSILEIKQQ